MQIPGGTWLIASGLPDAGAFDNTNGIFDLSNHTAGTYSFTYSLSAAAPCASDQATVTVNIADGLSATLTPSATVCNTSAEGSTLNFSSLVTNGDTNGTWTDTDGSGASGIFPTLDFDGVATGIYTFTYTLNAADPCADVVQTASVTVNNCQCPDVVTNAAPDLCNEGSTLDLTTLYSGTAAGTWVVTDASNNTIALNGTTLDATGLAAGNYTATFTLNTAPPTGCANSSQQNIVVVAAANAGIGASSAYCSDDNTVINLYDLLSGEQSGGIWTLVSGTPDAGAFDASNATLNIADHSTALLTFAYTITGNAPCTDDSEQVTVSIDAVQTAIVIPIISVCNASAEGSVLDFSTLVSSTSSSGTWADTDGSGASGTFPTLDFDGVAVGIYTFSYTLSGSGNCPDVIYTTEVSVENCACPNVATAPAPALCNDGGTLDLATLQLGTELGTWTVTDATNNTIAISGTTFDATGLAAGNYTATFTLTTTVVGCPDSSVQIIVANNAPNAGIGDAVTVCNNAAVTVSLAELLSGADSGGTWSLDSGTPDTGAFDATAATFNTDGHSPGVFTFSYTLSANAPCTDAVSVVSVTVEDCNCATPATPTATVDALAVCAGTVNTAAFVAVPAPNTAIIWYNGSNPTTADSLAAGNDYVPIVAGTYYAIAYNIPADACFSEALPFVLTENPMPSVAFTANADTACVGQTLTFTLTSATSASATYTWSFGVNAIPLTATGSTATAQWNVAGMPEVLLTANDNDCEADTSLSIAISTVEANISPAETTLYNGGSVVLQVAAIGLRRRDKLRMDNCYWLVLH
ncbi:MAG: hypothetical protein IPL33_07265 [Sphingobacteriales bacterium]|nr:hypothetical protein [Sphingobacteriales bacterium]